MRLVGVSEASHAAHDTENVVVGSIDANLGSLDTLNGSVGENKLESSVVNAREVATAAGLVLFGAKGKRVNVDTGVGSGGVVLVGLHGVEVGTLTLREAVLAVKLELGGDDGVVAPAVEEEGGLGEDEGAGIGDAGVLKVANLGWVAIVGGLNTLTSKVGTRVPDGVYGSIGVVVNGTVPPAGTIRVNRSSIVEQVVVDEGLGGEAGGLLAAEGVDGVGKGIHGIGVVEGLGAEEVVEELTALKGRAVVNVAVGLDDPDELLNGVVEVELDLVGRGTDGLVTGELELLDEVLVGVLGHAPALISVQEDVVHVEGGGNKGLVVSGDDLATGGGADAGAALEGANGPQALVNGADVKVDLDLVVLKSDEGEGETGVAAVPELEGHVEGGLGEGVAGSANLARGGSLARAINIVKRRISDVGELGGVADHGVVAAALVNGQGELVPDVHPITVLAVNALATDLNLNLRDELLTGEVKPTGINTVLSGGLHLLVDLGESDLQVSAVSQITVAGNGASDTATEVSLAVKSLLNGLHGKVGVAFVRNLPESNLGVASQVNVLGAIGDKLH
uniref:Uncharacterized protein n=1 Tax=viral metagenome TaxID=1070528 RepID=A0A6C0I6K7_9ZZZZ